MMPALAIEAGRVAALRSEIGGFQALTKVLTAEADALRRADAIALLVLAAEKLEHVASLQALARQRAQDMQRAGVANNAAGVQAWLAQAGDAATAHAAWRQLTQLALEAKCQNTVNGRLAARQRWHFDAALATLLQAAGVSSVYGADGRARRTSFSQGHITV